MPAIIVNSLELTDAQKEILCEKFVAAFSEVSRVPPDRIYVFFNGYALDSVGTGVGLFSKNPPKQAIGKFNQPEG
jgi:phenylpyruvate tautomerase PptA (4-oxalocrotonate tautomerase family)